MLPFRDKQVCSDSASISLCTAWMGRCLNRGAAPAHKLLLQASPNCTEGGRQSVRRCVHTYSFWRAVLSSDAHCIPPTISHTLERWACVRVVPAAYRRNCDEKDVQCTQNSCCISLLLQLLLQLHLMPAQSRMRQSCPRAALHLDKANNVLLDVAQGQQEHRGYINDTAQCMQVCQAPCSSTGELEECAR